MKCLPMWEPWATLMALGVKTIETRGWATSHRGPMAIQATKSGLSKADFLETVEHTPGIYAALSTVPGFCEWFNRKGRGIKLDEVLPLGKIIAVVSLRECVPTTAHNQLKYASADAVRVKESYFGDYTCGRFGWMTDNLFRLPRPIPFVAHQGFNDLEVNVVVELRDQWRDVFGQAMGGIKE